jgi:hypothetical protein
LRWSGLRKNRDDAGAPTEKEEVVEAATAGMADDEGDADAAISASWSSSDYEEDEEYASDDGVGFPPADWITPDQHQAALQKANAERDEVYAEIDARFKRKMAELEAEYDREHAEMLEKLEKMGRRMRQIIGQTEAPIVEDADD